MLGIEFGSPMCKKSALSAIPSLCLHSVLVSCDFHIEKWGYGHFMQSVRDTDREMRWECCCQSLSLTMNLIAVSQGMGCVVSLALLLC